MNTISGTSGRNVIVGTAQDDLIDGGFGSDTLRGGDGADHIVDKGGTNNFINGGGGDDLIVFEDYYTPSYTQPFGTLFISTTITAGAGNDEVRFLQARDGVITIDLGAGNDLLWLGKQGGSGLGDGQLWLGASGLVSTTSITLGAGQDRVILTESINPSGAITLTDFTAGDGGDVIDVSRALATLDGTVRLTDNPFATGLLYLTQDGDDTLLWTDLNGPDPASPESPLAVLLRFEHVDVAQLTAQNFAGFDLAGRALLPVALTGTDDDELLLASPGGGEIVAGGGNDRVEGGTGTDALHGGAGNDTINGSVGDDALFGDGGRDTLDGGEGNDRLEGGDDNDHLISTLDGSDVLDGGAGDDTFTINHHDDPPFGTVVTAAVTVIGGMGNDHLFYEQSGRVVQLDVDLGAGDDDVTIDFSTRLALRQLTSATLTLGTGHDTVIVKDFGDLNSSQQIVVTDFAAGDGGDRLDMSSMLSRPLGLVVDNGFNSGHLRLIQQGEDTLVAFDPSGEGGADVVFGIVLLQDVNVDSLTADNFVGMSPRLGPTVGISLTGTDTADHVIGNAGGDTIRVGAGDDIVRSMAGNDTLFGEKGDDTLDAGMGDDVVYGGAGNDYLSAESDGTDSLNGGDGDDVIDLPGSSFSSNGDTKVTGGAGADIVNVNAGYVKLSVNLGDGDDRIVFTALPAGGSKLTLGAGSDTVAFDPSLVAFARTAVTITDFQAGDGGDVLDVAEWFREKVFNQGGLIGLRATMDKSYNPYFMNTAALLVQQGADTLVQFPGWNSETIAVLKNTDAQSLTSWNLGGIELFPTTATLTDGDDIASGTDANDVIHAGMGNDVVNGLSGDDLLIADGGTDKLYGGEGNDSLMGAGNSQLFGGAGDDVLIGGLIEDGGKGNDLIIGSYAGTITGGAGNDRIELEGGGRFHGSVKAGDGNDSVWLSDPNVAFETGTKTAIDLGAGNDFIEAGLLRGTITLGSGRDTVRAAGYQHYHELIITDFETGDAGDIVDLSLSNSNPRINPFAIGNAGIVQSGADTVLTVGGLNQMTRIRFLNTNVADFTAANFDGFDPSPPGFSLRRIVTDKTVAAGTSIIDSKPLPVPGSGPIYAPYVYSDPTLSATFTNHGTIEVNLTDRFTPGTVVVVKGDVPSLGAPTEGAVINAADGKIIVHADAGNVGVVQAEVDFRNYGTIEASGSETRDRFITVTGMFGTLNAGSITATGGGTITGMGGIGPAENSGHITVISEGGERAFGATGKQFRNSGAITVQGADTAIGISAAAVHNTKSIVAHGTDHAVGAYMNIEGDSVQTPLFNAGTITADVQSTSQYASVGAWIVHYFSQTTPMHIENRGIIRADIAVILQGSTQDNSREVLVNTGTLQGTVLTWGGDDVIRNRGSMSGRTLLGNGNDTYDGLLGRHSGSVEGGVGNDTLIGGSRIDALFGGDGDDVLNGGGYDDFLDGGTGADMIDGGAGQDVASWLDAASPMRIDLLEGSAISRNEIDYVRGVEQVIGSRGGDRILAADGDETLIGFLGRDFLDGRAGNDILWGGKGADHMTGGSGDDTFVFEAGDGPDTITDFGPGDVAEVHGYAGAVDMVQESAGVRLVLSGTDSILLSGCTIADVTDANVLFTNDPIGYELPKSSTSPIQSSHLVISAGMKVDIADPDPLLTPYFPSYTSQGVSLSPGITKSPRVWIDGELQVVTTTQPDKTVGVGFMRTVVIGNEGRLTVSAEHGTALALETPQGVWNKGTIAVTAYEGEAGGVLMTTPPSDGDPGGIVNDGTIAVTAAGVARGCYGAPMFFGNYGQILVSGAGGSVGLHSEANGWHARPVVVNAGLIDVTDDTTACDSAGIELEILAPTKLWNSGTITADYAVKVTRLASYTPDFGYFLHFANTGKLNGAVLMSAYDDKVANKGAIKGDVDMGGGDDLFDGRSGTLTGRLSGYDGDDVLLTGRGHQIVDGGFGNDTLSGGSGNDLLVGGAGRDSFRFSEGGGADTISDFAFATEHDWIDVEGYSAALSITQQGADVLITFSESDTLLVRNASVAQINADVLRFGAVTIPKFGMGSAPDAPHQPGGPHALRADPARTFAPVDGTDNANILSGAPGPDKLSGQGGNDTIVGLGGNDLLIGGAGADVLTGGSGSDIFRFLSVNDSLAGAADRIVDFQHGDQIDLSGIDAISGGADDAFHWIGTAAPTVNGAGVVWFDEAKHILYGSVDNDIAPEFKIILASTVTISQEDVIM